MVQGVGASATDRRLANGGASPAADHSGGGTFSTGGIYSLGGTSGQPDAGALSGGAYTLGGGFWGGGELAPPQNAIYLPLLLRNY